MRERLYKSTIPIFLLLVTVTAITVSGQTKTDVTLLTVRRSDQASRGPNGKLQPLTAAEHARRANIYMTNRAFTEAREHWETLLAFFPDDSNVPSAIFGIGRSLFWERRYAEALPYFERVFKNYPNTKDGSEGLTFTAASLLRLGRASEAVEYYKEYIEKYPAGERFEQAHLNVIDSLREAGQPLEAIPWIVLTRQRFAGKPTEMNAMFAMLRLDLAEGNWKHAIAAADEMSTRSFTREVQTTRSEVTYLKAYSLEQVGRRQEAIDSYISIADAPDSYYGWLASERLRSLLGNDANRITERRGKVNAQIADSAATYRDPYRDTIVSSSRRNKLDPRFVLAIIRQESQFNPLAKSPSGARGLLQLTIDTAQKYGNNVGLPAVGENQLYSPATSIALGCQYLADLFRMFPDFPEAVAASYNGGEDNVERWIKRSGKRDGPLFTAEIGFDQTKAYVQKVMANYRVYKLLYTETLIRR